MTAIYIEVLSGCSIAFAALSAGLSWRCRDQARRLRRAEAGREALLLEERHRIACDIHDDLGQNLLTLKLDTAALLRTPGLPPQAEQHLQGMLVHTDATVRSMRTVINGLRPVALENGLHSAVERQLYEFTRVNGIGCQLEDALYCSDAACPADVTVLRVLQESLSNIARHADATEVKIALCRNASELRLTVYDNGGGLPGGPLRRGWGLLGMQRRVAAAGGCMALASNPGQGTALTISIPTVPATNPTLSAANQPGFARNQA
ncbi:sensor histidine kinase [Pseudoduganella namucuonensis]|uniref:Oxygen sensor histidine kinase NreB n=1 Tax=Pseudoduganella namucuonensis TaxID=1035707 RepID=A0A1I7M5L0_9BURK|nr:sensor histidine kinase [Pseudoduganella namucuonensis]SFV17234.1 Histidine kinase-, DNA gyrase B-, and HSP90-like ATPase [Pseudoduganella namucuonensis]